MKKIISLLAAALAVSALSGCKTDSTADSSTPNSNGSYNTNSSDTVNPNGTAQTAPTIKDTNISNMNTNTPQ
jgi:uncharacterized lipoprotein